MATKSYERYENGVLVEEREIQIDDNIAIRLDIEALEQTVTPRRIREAIRTDQGRIWLASVDDQIAALRAQLQP